MLTVKKVIESCIVQSWPGVPDGLTLRLFGGPEGGNAMEEIFIVGVGMTRFGKHRDRSVKSLVAEAVGNALSDANAQQGDVGAAVFSNITQGIMEGQHAIRGQVALRSMGFSEIPIVNVENACAGEIGRAHV